MVEPMTLSISDCNPTDTMARDTKIAVIEAALIERTPPSSDIECIKRPGWVQWLRRGVQSPLTNRIWFSRLSDEEVDERIAETIATYRALNLPLMWMLSPGSRPTNLAERLLAHGFRHYVDVRGMIAHVDDILKAAATSINPAIQVTVVDESNMKDWLTLYARGWNVDEETKNAVRREMKARFEQPNERVIEVLARYEGEACGAASLDIFNGFGLFLNGFVLPELRHKGVFRSMVAARASILKQRNIPFGVIHALAQTAAPIVHRLGFEDVCEMSAYTYP